jgi:hypothetical protein
MKPLRLSDGRFVLVTATKLHREHRRGVYRRPTDRIAQAANETRWGRTRREALERLMGLGNEAGAMEDGRRNLRALASDIGGKGCCGPGRATERNGGSSAISWHPVSKRGPSRGQLHRHILAERPRPTRGARIQVWSRVWSAMRLKSLNCNHSNGLCEV